MFLDPAERMLPCYRHLTIDASPASLRGPRSEITNVLKLCQRTTHGRGRKRAMFANSVDVDRFRLIGTSRHKRKNTPRAVGQTRDTVLYSAVHRYGDSQPIIQPCVGAILVAPGHPGKNT